MVCVCRACVESIDFPCGADRRTLGDGLDFANPRYGRMRRNDFTVKVALIAVAPLAMHAESKLVDSFSHVGIGQLCCSPLVAEATHASAQNLLRAWIILDLKC